MEHIEYKNVKNVITSKATNIITNYRNKSKLYTIVFIQWYTEANRFLRKKLDIIVTRAEKGNVTISMIKHQHKM